MPGWTNFLIPSWRENRPHWRAAKTRKTLSGGGSAAFAIGQKSRRQFGASLQIPSRCKTSQMGGNFTPVAGDASKRGRIILWFPGHVIYYVFFVQLRHGGLGESFLTICISQCCCTSKPDFMSLFKSGENVAVIGIIRAILQEAACGGGRKSRRPSDGRLGCRHPRRDPAGDAGQSGRVLA